jgi:hypothetical protein
LKNLKELTVLVEELPKNQWFRVGPFDFLRTLVKGQNGFYDFSEPLGYIYRQKDNFNKVAVYVWIAALS